MYGGKHMQLREEKKNDVHMFIPEGRLDSNTASTFEQKVDEVISTGVKWIIIDFKNLEYVSSAGLRVIFKIITDLERLEGKLVLCSMVDYIKELFEVSGFDSFARIMDNRDEAQKLFY
jgi:anti-sigma B factor antagonist